jgi:hypothetical protein
VQVTGQCGRFMQSVRAGAFPAGIARTYRRFARFLFQRIKSSLAWPRILVHAAKQLRNLRPLPFSSRSPGNVSNSRHAVAKRHQAFVVAWITGPVSLIPGLRDWNDAIHCRFMNASAARLCLWICPALIVVTWGFVSRSADVPFVLVPLVMFALVAAIGTAARTVPRKTLAIAAAIGGVTAIVPGMPLAVLAMIGGPGVGGPIGVHISGVTWIGMSPVLGWTLAAVILITAAVAICWGAVLLGTTIRRSESKT